MSFTQAFQRAGIKPTTPPTEDEADWQPPDPEQVPMMYRAQVQGRCSLQYGKNNHDLKRWTKEWVYPNNEDEQKPFYQNLEPSLERDDSIYRIKIEFPFRVLTNCGQDSILRPTIGVNGIPFIPGSSIKGLFQRLCYHPQVSDALKNQVKDYCGTPEKPGILRFHGAYPVGDWAGTTTVELKNKSLETRYRMVDVVHPQQPRQVQEQGSPKAIAAISFYQPTFIFELSSTKVLSEKQWETIGGLLKRALRPGLGGKTSTGYGLYVIPQDQYSLSLDLSGRGVSSLLRSDEPEFRPNLFKATLRGHLTRLLAGVIQDEDLIKNTINQLFGHTTEPGVLQLYWETKPGFPKPFNYGFEQTPSYEIEGTLYLDAPSQHLNILRTLLKFTVVMAGLGKSWRRVWHEEFYPNYQTRGIGCHWQILDSNFDFPKIQTEADLQYFLNSVREEVCNYLGINLNYNTPYMPWKEAWHPQRLSVYSQVVSQSEAITLFHDQKFKTTPAIGGRKPGDERPTSFSCVWHRMLPINSSEYLEIITIFHGGGGFIPRDYPWSDKWCRENSPGQKENQFPLFVGKLKNQGFQLTWGTEVDLN
jgi:CRISPR-associated protein Cmr6